MTRETPFSMTYGVEAILPVEIEMSTLKVTAYDDGANIDAMNGELDLVEERRLDSYLQLAAYQQRTTRYYNKR